MLQPGDNAQTNAGVPAGQPVSPQAQNSQTDLNGPGSNAVDTTAVDNLWQQAHNQLLQAHIQLLRSQGGLIPELVAGSTLADVQASLPMAQAAYNRAMQEWQASQQENDSPVTSVQTNQPAVSATAQVGSPVAQPQPTQPNPSVARQAPGVNRAENGRFAGNAGGMARPRTGQQVPEGLTGVAKLAWYYGNRQGYSGF